MKEEEKRRFSRINFQAEVEIRHHNLTTSGKIKDLSLQGMYVFCDVSFPQDSNVDIKITARTPAAELTLKLDGKVVRSEKGGMAVEFSKMDLDTFMHLKNIVALNLGNLDKILDEFHDFIKKRVRGRHDETKPTFLSNNPTRDKIDS